MRAPSFIKALSFPPTRRSGSYMIAPLPRESLFFQQVIGEVDIVRSAEFNVGSFEWLSSVVNASIATQGLAKEYILDGNYSNSNVSSMDKEMINEYLEDNIELLDACNVLVEKMGVIQEYVHTLKVVTRSSRAQEVLTKCGQMEKECAKLDKCNSKLSRLLGQKMNTQVNISYDLQEILCMSREMATIACFRLQMALSLKSKQGFLKLKSFKSTTFNDLLISKDEDIRKSGHKCLSPWMMNELEQLIMACKLWDNQQVNVDLLRKNCETLEEELKMLEEKVREMYRHLISIRVALLGVLSQY